LKVIAGSMFSFGAKILSAIFVHFSACIFGDLANFQSIT